MIPLVGGMDYTAELMFFDSFNFLLFFSSTFLAILDRIILFDMAAKSIHTSLNKKDETYETDISPI